MLDPIRLVTDLFKEKNLSDSHLRAFCDEFLIRLSNPELNPGGIYNTLLVDTTTLYQNYYGSIKNQVVKEAVGKGLTIGMNMASNEVVSKLSVLQGLIKYHFGAKSEVYKEFYPRGMKEYYRATIGKRGILAHRFKTLSDLHLTGPFPAEAAEVDALVLAFKNAREAQEGNFGIVAGFVSDRKNGRRALTHQLTKCFLRIASDHVEQPVQFHAYYDTRLLPIRKAKKKVKPETQEEPGD